MQGQFLLRGQLLRHLLCYGQGLAPGARLEQGQDAEQNARQDPREKGRQ